MIKKYLFISVIPLILLSSSVFAQTIAEHEAMNYFIKAGMYEDWGNLTYAYSYFKAAEKKDRDNQMVKLALARVALTMGKFKEAAGYASWLVEEGAETADAAIYLAEANYRLEKPAEAAANLESIVDDMGGYRRLRVLKFLYRIYNELEETGKGIKTLEEAFELQPDDIFVNYRLGLEMARKGKRSEAAAYLEKVIEDDPAYADAASITAAILLEQGSRDKAKQVLRKSFQADPENNDVAARLFELISEDKDYRFGIEILEPLYSKGRLRNRGLVELGRYYYETGMNKEAVEAYQTLMESTGRKAPILRIICDIELESGKFRNAAECLSQLIQEQPDNFDNYVGYLLIMHDAAGEPSGPEQTVEISTEDSLRIMKKALSCMDSQSVRHNYIVGMVLNEAGRMDRSLKYLLRAEELSPDDRDVLLELARAYEEAGEPEKALARVKRLYSADTGDPVLKNYYGYLLALNGDRLIFAEQLLNQALEHDPDNGYYLDSLGWIKYKQGEYQRALEILLDAARAVNDDPKIWEHLGDTYVKLEAIDEAREAYRKSIKLSTRKSQVIRKLQSIESRDQVNRESSD
ncbi:MAG: tetratricopeptide repeat protein [Candidatus Krumholzibacteriales bacterium]